MQILDIVHLRPEIQLIYAGISVKVCFVVSHVRRNTKILQCFEILENRPSNYDLRSDGLDVSDDHVATNDGLLSDDESEATEDDDDDIGAADAVDESSSEVSYDDQDDSDGDDSYSGDGQKAPKLKLREIMYYEEKVRPGYTASVRLLYTNLIKGFYFQSASRDTQTLSCARGIHFSFSRVREAVALVSISMSSMAQVWYII
jgi:hypothetical protein